jgi:hypothetical protein
LQPGLTFVHPVTGFHVDSVHSIEDFAMRSHARRSRAFCDAAPAKVGFRDRAASIQRFANYSAAVIAKAE